MANANANAFSSLGPGPGCERERQEGKGRSGNRASVEKPASLVYFTRGMERSVYQNEMTHVG